MSKKILNMTPHPVNIIDEENKVILSIQPTGLVRLKAITVKKDSINGIPTSSTEFGQPDGLPDFSFGTFIIVSQLVKSALPQRTDLLVPAEVVRDKEGNIIGCRSLGR